MIPQETFLLYGSPDAAVPGLYSVRFVLQRQGLDEKAFVFIPKDIPAEILGIITVVFLKKATALLAGVVRFPLHRW